MRCSSVCNVDLFDLVPALVFSSRLLPILLLLVLDEEETASLKPEASVPSVCTKALEANDDFKCFCQ